VKTLKSGSSKSEREDKIGNSFPLFALRLTIVHVLLPSSVILDSSTVARSCRMSSKVRKSARKTRSSASLEVEETKEDVKTSVDTEMESVEVAQQPVCALCRCPALIVTKLDPSE
jgi:hypothetical protein